MMRRLLPFVAVFLLLAADARASCAPPNPRAQIKYADAAFDGRFESERRDGQSRRLIFRVDRVIKGSLGGTVEIHEQGVSTISFGSFAAGERVGLMMNFADGTWRSNDCLRYDPVELADAVKPIPRPPGRGTARFLVAGSFGDARSVLLDHRARTLAYGFGGGIAASVCPGARRIVGLGHRKLIVLRTSDLKVIERRAIAPAQGAHCLGKVVVIATTSGLFRGRRRIWRGESTGFTFHGRHAYVARGRSIVRVDLDTGRSRTLAQLSLPPDYEPLRELAVSPDGRRVAVLAVNHAVRADEPPSKLAVIHVAERSLRTAELPGPNLDGSLVWVADDRFAFLPYPAHFRRPDGNRTTLFFGTRLQREGQIPGWTASAPIGGGGAVIGVVGHRVERATPDGVTSELGRLPSGFHVPAILPLGAGVQIRASRRIPRY